MVVKILLTEEDSSVLVLSLTQKRHVIKVRISDKHINSFGFYSNIQLKIENNECNS